MIRHGEYFYAFYAGAGCCGRGCTYAMGVARAKNLLGPWEKYEKNPLFTGNDTWKCPGHGTPIEKDGKYYVLYHAYHPEGDVYVGRQGVLKEFRFTENNWIELVEENSGKPLVPARLMDEFSGSTLSPHWQWSVFQKPVSKIKNGEIELTASPEPSGVFLGQRIFTADYQAEVTVLRTSSKAEAGLALVGDEKNLIAVSVRSNTLTVWKLENDKATILGEQTIAFGEKIRLRVRVKNGKDVSFSFSLDEKAFTNVSESPVDGFYLPPWDRAVRVAILSKGKPDTKAAFDDFVLDNQ
jgi:beta-xylosidase